MSDSSPLLDRAAIEEAFRLLGERLAKRGVVADLYVFGGAAMALAYDSRRTTRVAPGGDPAASRVFDHPGLRVFAASPEHLLAMKAFAARPRDAEDIFSDQGN